MRIIADLPELKRADVNRCWLPPVELCQLAGLDDASAQEVRNLLSNASLAGLIPFERAGRAKTSPKLYSATGAAMLRTVWEMTRSGRSYEFVAPVAHVIGEMMGALVENLPRIDDLDRADGLSHLVIYACDGNGQIVDVRQVTDRSLAPRSLLGDHGGFDVGVVFAGEIVWNVLRHYPDFWRRDLAQRTAARRRSLYRGADPDGNPLDPDHPFNRDRPAVDRARRLLEIEEFIEALMEREVSE
ncbi:hypothetical protein [Zavarzinia sp.]|uniref:hypothetical protein n=1 Tax=Zavarzinia sp. TaxID=2027920 RepID=UPI003569B261